MADKRRFSLDLDGWLLPAAAAIVAAVVLLPGLGSYGLWDPHEIAIADGARTLSRTGGVAAAWRTQPPLGAWLLSASVKLFGPSELAVRLPFALCGVVAAAATALLGARLRRPRTGLFAAIVLSSSPLFVFQGRQLMSDLDAIAATSLAMLGLVGLLWPTPGASATRAVVDWLLALAGLALGLLASGLFLGVVVPVAAVTLASALAVGGRYAPTALPDAQATRWRHRLGLSTSILGALALLALALLAYEIWDVVPAQPGDLAIAGKTIRAGGRYVPLLGGAWRPGPGPADATFDAVIAQVGFGLFPWSALAPLAVLRLATPRSRDRDAWGGLVFLAWALVAYAASALWAREAGDLRFPGLVPIALAVGAWLDDLVRAKLEGDPTHAPSAADGMPVAAAFVFLAAVLIGLDTRFFPEELAAVHLAAKGFKFPAEPGLVRLLLVVVTFGALFAVAAAVGLAVAARVDASARRRLVVKGGLFGALGIGYAFGVFLAMAYTPALSQHFSYKNLFAAYIDHRTGEEPLGVMGIPGTGPEYYARGPYRRLNTVRQLLDLLKSPERAFAIAPVDRLCALHEAAQPDGVRYHVLDTRNSRFYLFTNRLLPGEVDRNPHADFYRKGPPERMTRTIGANFEDTIQLLGVDMPDKVEKGSRFKLTLYYRVLRRPTQSYKIFIHFDGFGARFQGDHAPLCSPTSWQPGDVIASTTEVVAGELTHRRGTYSVYTGFFIGGGGVWKNMNVLTPQRDSANRVPIGSLKLE